jgi:hypothetical protein
MYYLLQHLKSLHFANWMYLWVSNDSQKMTAINLLNRIRDWFLHRRRTLRGWNTLLKSVSLFRFHIQISPSVPLSIYISFTLYFVRVWLGMRVHPLFCVLLFLWFSKEILSSLLLSYIVIRTISLQPFTDARTFVLSFVFTENFNNFSVPLFLENVPNMFWIQFTCRS